VRSSLKPPSGFLHLGKLRQQVSQPQRDRRDRLNAERMGDASDQEDVAA